MRGHSVRYGLRCNRWFLNPMTSSWPNAWWRRSVPAVRAGRTSMPETRRYESGIFLRGSSSPASRNAASSVTSRLRLPSFADGWRSCPGQEDAVSRHQPHEQRAGVCWRRNGGEVRRSSFEGSHESTGRSGFRDGFGALGAIHVVGLLTALSDMRRTRIALPSRRKDCTVTGSARASLPPASATRSRRR